MRFSDTVAHYAYVATKRAPVVIAAAGLPEGEDPLDTQAQQQPKWRDFCMHGNSTKIVMFFFVFIATLTFSLCSKACCGAERQH
jgi:hypothetical protein